jgi:hypothetical protein
LVKKIWLFLVFWGPPPPPPPCPGGLCSEVLLHLAVYKPPPQKKKRATALRAGSAALRAGSAALRAGSAAPRAGSAAPRAWSGLARPLPGLAAGSAALMAPAISRSSNFLFDPLLPTNHWSSRYLRSITVRWAGSFNRWSLNLLLLPSVAHWRRCRANHLSAGR